MTVVVDASVAIKWVLEEDGSEAARQLLSEEPLTAPDFLIIECANVLWAASRRGRLAIDRAKAGLTAIQGAPIQFLATGDYSSAAQELAFELEHPVYDTLYLAVALAERAVLVTADSRLVASVARHGSHSHAVKLLGAV